MNNKKLSQLTQRQLVALHAAKVAQKTVRIVTLGKLKPFWVIHLAGHFLSKNRAEKNLEIGDTDPDPPSLRYVERKMTIIATNTSRYKRRAQIRPKFAPS
jgi:hypothetical protein